MKPVKTLMAFLIGAGFAVGEAHAQVARQALSFVIFGQYQTNMVETNSLYTYEHKIIDTAVFTVGDLVRALAFDQAPTNYTTLLDTTLVRETEFTNGLIGREGIFLYRQAPFTNINVSTNFALNFTNDFTQNVTNIFPGVTTLGVNNTINGGVFPPGSTNTNTLVSDGLFSVTFYTSQMQFNLIGYGTTTEANFTGEYRGVRYSGPVQTLRVLTGVGSYGLNVTSPFNSNSVPSVPDTNFASGPAHGYFSTGAPVFITNSPDSVFNP